MPVLMDVSNHDSDGFEFDVVVGEEEGGGALEVGALGASPRSAVPAPWQMTKLQLLSQQLAHSSILSQTINFSNLIMTCITAGNCGMR